MSSIVLFGNGMAAVNVVSSLTKSGEYELTIVVDPADNGEDNWQPSLKKYCQDNNISFLQPASFTKRSFIKKLKQIAPKIMLSVQCRKILSQEIIDIVDGEIFNMHFALLPKMRGCYPVFWHIKNGDLHGGVTLHKLTAGIDEGALIDQVKIPIDISTTTRSLYESCAAICPSLLQKHIKSLISSTYRSTVQDPKQATYYSIKSVDFSQYYINWNEPVGKVSRFIQAFSFPPLQFAHTRVDKHEIEITNVTKTKEELPQFQPGTVVSASKQIIEVQAVDGIITAEYKSGHKIKKGMVLYI